MIPTLAVVGHPNKGKSSIVATLAEDERVAIGTTPGTTRRADPHTLTIDGEPQYVLVDTPGFQRARAVLDWLEARAARASERSECVAAFVDEHRDDARFRDECELLTPIVDGAGILYVVDGTKPYGAEYELEMQILQWTGRPRLALINMIGDDDHSQEWRRALDQYFSIVRVFDAMNADFENRINLLRAFAELDERWRRPMESAVAALSADRERRRERSAREIAGCLVSMLSASERDTLAAEASDAERAALQEKLTQRLKQRLTKREREARETVQAVYRWHTLSRSEAEEPLLGADLFASDGWELFGLSERKLLLAGVMSGAVAGGGIDVLLGGASLLLGATIGAVLGGAGLWLGGHELAKLKVLGESLGGRVLSLGPVSAPNFPWVVLGRAWIHHHLVSERNHARREALSLELSGSRHVMDALPDELRGRLTKLFERIRGGAGEELVGPLAETVAELLELEPGSKQGDGRHGS